MTDSEETIWSRRSNLQGMIWKVGYKVATPYLFKSENSSLHGFTHEIWLEIEKGLNVTSHLIEDEGYGKMIAEDEWNGLLGLVQHADVDISLTPMSYTYARLVTENVMHNTTLQNYALGARLQTF